MLSKASVSWLIFCLDGPSFDVSEVSKSPTINILLPFSPFMSVFVLFIQVLLCWVHMHFQVFYLLVGLNPLHYLMSFFVSCYNFCCKSILSYISIATSAFILFPFAWNTFFYLLTFSVCTYLDLKWVSCRQHLYVLFLIHSAITCIQLKYFVHLHLN